VSQTSVLEDKTHPEERTAGDTSVSLKAH